MIGMASCSWCLWLFKKYWACGLYTVKAFRCRLRRRIERTVSLALRPWRQKAIIPHLQPPTSDLLHLEILSPSVLPRRPLVLVPVSLCSRHPLSSGRRMLAPHSRRSHPRHRDNPRFPAFLNLLSLANPSIQLTCDDTNLRIRIVWTTTRTERRRSRRRRRRLRLQTLRSRTSGSDSIRTGASPSLAFSL